MGDLNTPGRVELFSVPVDGSAAPVNLSINHTLGSGPWSLDPDGSHVVYVGQIGTAWNGPRDLVRAPVDGTSAPIVLAGPQPNRIINGFAFADGGARMVYVFPGERAVFLADALEDERFELFAAPADGSEAAVQLNPALVAGGDVDPFSVRRTADGPYVAFCADAALDGVNSLYSARVDGSVPAQLLHGASHVDADSLTLDPLREAVLFVAGGELFRVQLDGLTPARALARPVGASAFGAPLVRPSVKGGAVYRVQLPSLRHALALADLDGGGTATLLTDPLPDLARFERILASLPNSGRVFYVADQEAVGTFELFGVFTPGPPSPHVRRR